MTSDDLILKKYLILDCKRFGCWVWLNDIRSGRISNVRKRKTLIKFLETILGPLGQRWQYQLLDWDYYIIKINDEKDLTFFLLKFKISK